MRKAAGVQTAFSVPAQISGSRPNVSAWGTGVCQNPQALLSSCSWHIHQEKYPLKDASNTEPLLKNSRLLLFQSYRPILQEGPGDKENIAEGKIHCKNHQERSLGKEGNIFNLSPKAQQDVRAVSSPPCPPGD